MTCSSNRSLKQNDNVSSIRSHTNNGAALRAKIGTTKRLAPTKLQKAPVTPLPITPTCQIHELKDQVGMHDGMNEENRSKPLQREIMNETQIKTDREPYQMMSIRKEPPY